MRQEIATVSILSFIGPRHSGSGKAGRISKGRPGRNIRNICSQGQRRQAAMGHPNTRGGKTLSVTTTNERTDRSAPKNKTPPGRPGGVLSQSGRGSWGKTLQPRDGSMLRRCTSSCGRNRTRPRPDQPAEDRARTETWDILRGNSPFRSILETHGPPERAG